MGIEGGRETGRGKGAVGKTSDRDKHTNVK